MSSIRSGSSKSRPSVFWQELDTELRRLRRSGVIEKCPVIEVGHKTYYDCGVVRNYEYSEHESVVEYQADAAESYEALLQRRYNRLLRALDYPLMIDTLCTTADYHYINPRIHQHINHQLRLFCLSLSNKISNVKTALKICCNDEVLKRIRYDLYCGRLVVPRPHSIELSLRNVLVQSKLIIGKKHLTIQDCNLPLISSITRNRFIDNIHLQLNELVTLIGTDTQYDCSS
ncbi:hypothetical protein GNI_044180 [Gregarina niphandrodes]|uniref:Uncharacterized protein n=1 Tax=Gregarina niphandrodes TaxID=110365 RepID=A0A023B9Y6_GRENI|nr:hypothetical protein GNI_044180 [Gregarina niphandrodes]EZG76625.1 hypothetical protein GNI_044180 [Gregarina niphandrodes]|eukprot:XP_011129559.1 hypothetical protein GNI_044180 [Gregarina niphandrodes]